MDLLKAIQDIKKEFLTEKTRENQKKVTGSRKKVLEGKCIKKVSSKKNKQYWVLQSTVEGRVVNRNV